MHVYIKNTIMKKILVFTDLAMGLTFATQAQSANPNKGEKREERKKMMADLNMSDDQSKQFKEANEDFRVKAQKIRDNSAIDKVEKKKQLMALNQERKTKVEEILTPEQQAKMKEMKKHPAKQ